MSDQTVESPVRWTARAIRRGWNALLTVYYANSVSWRVLKAGALLFLGFFLWAGSNLLLSYRPGWGLLRYTLAYGFVLVVYGPFHHLVVIPVYQRLRRRGRSLSLGGHPHLHLPNLSLAVFLVLVVVLGTVPVGPMTIDFASSLGEAGVDIDPALHCVQDAPNGTAVVHCHLSESRGIDRVVVASGGRQLAVDDDPPFEFTVRADRMSTVMGTRQFRVELLAADGSLVRRYTRRLDAVEEGRSPS